MATIHPEPMLVYVIDDGAGTHHLKVQAKDGTLQAWPLTLERTVSLIGALARTAKELEKQGRKTPHFQGDAE